MHRCRISRDGGSTVLVFDRVLKATLEDALTVCIVGVKARKRYLAQSSSSSALWKHRDPN